MDLSLRYDISLQTVPAGLARQGFGEPLVYGYVPTTIIPVSERTRRYTTATFSTEMVADGFAVTDPVYLAVAAIAAQNPRPRTVKVGRGALSFTHAIELTPTTDAVGETISFTMTKGTTSIGYTRTCAGGGVPAEAAAIAVLMNAAGGWGAGGTAELTIAAVGADVEVDAIVPANANEMWYYSDLHNIGFADVGVDRGVATDLTNIQAYDDDWYAVCLADAFGAVEIAAAAGWVETKTKILVVATQDRAPWAAGTGIADTLRAAARKRTYLVSSQHSMAEYPGCAVAGRFLPYDPGTVVWADKSLSGVTGSTLTTAQLNYLHADYCNSYSLRGAGLEANLYKGWSSDGSFIDIIHLADYIVGTIQYRLYSAQRRAKKIPFTDAGVSIIEGIVRNVLRELMPEAVVTGSDYFYAPKVADVDPSDKALRQLPDVTFGFTITGAVMDVSITGYMSL